MTSFVWCLCFLLRPINNTMGLKPFWGNKGWQFLGRFHSSGNQEIKEWQFNIPRGTRRIKSIPRGPRGISGNEIFWNLHAYYKKSQYIFFHFTQFFKNSLWNLIFSDIFWLSLKKELNFQFSRSSRSLVRTLRSRGVIKPIPRGIGEWKKVRTLGNEDLGTPRSIPW